jgi:proteasome lid subunit RPN8/RPN11
MRMAVGAYRAILRTVCRHAPETGGILLGPVGDGAITEFYFDATAACSGVTYTPDYATLSRLMREVWVPAGLELRGFCHSHPPGLDRLSGGDLVYIGRLLNRNPDMAVFHAPIVLPHALRFCPIVVDRLDPSRGTPAVLELF